MDLFKKGWFTETGWTRKNQAFSFAVDEVLFQKQSPFQEIIVCQSKTFGRTLILDNVIQCTEVDEFSYQEMISFLPVNSHPDPKSVLVIGGGDGGVVRELLKLSSIESVTMCEIDQDVIDISKKYLPFMSYELDNPRLNLYVGDGLEFVKNHQNQFDVIITDSSDPVGPGVALFEKPYYEILKAALKPNGIVCSQAESFWYDRDFIKQLITQCSDIFPVVSYASAYVPTYPSGQIGFLLCSLNPETDFKNPCRVFTPEEQETMKLRYYSTDIHKSAFVLPYFIQKDLFIKKELP